MDLRALFDKTQHGLTILGGAGSGNHGHSGRPGQVGGSGGGGGTGGGGGASGAASGRYKDPDGSKAAATAAAIVATEKALKSGKAEDHEAAAALHAKAGDKHPSAGYSVAGKFTSTKDDIMFGSHQDMYTLHKVATGDPEFADEIIESEDDLDSALEHIKEYSSAEGTKRWADEDDKYDREIAAEDSGKFPDGAPGILGKKYLPGKK